MIFRDNVFVSEAVEINVWHISKKIVPGLDVK